MIRVAHANKLLVRQINQSTSLGNGLQISNETQNRKDVVVGFVVDSKGKEWVNKNIYFPLYSALPLSYNGDNFLVVDTQDVLAIDDSTNNM